MAEPQAAAAAHELLVRIKLPAELAAQYDALSDLSGEPIDTLLSSALRRALDYTDASYAIDKTGDAEIRRLLGGRVDSQAKLLDMIRRLVSVHVGGHRVELRPAVMEQIMWAARSLGKPVEEVAPQMIAEAVAEKFRA